MKIKLNSVRNAMRKCASIRHSNVGGVDPAAGLTSVTPEKSQCLPLFDTSKKDTESLPDALCVDAFGFREGDYALIHYIDGTPNIRRVWDRFSVEELYLLLPDLKDRMDKGYPVFPEEKMDSTHPLWDVRNRLRG